MNLYEEKLKYAQAQQATQMAGGCEAAQSNETPASYYGDTCCNSKLGAPLIERLAAQRREKYNSAERIDRVIGIMQRHPEFEEFLEVLRSGLV